MLNKSKFFVTCAVLCFCTAVAASDLSNAIKEQLDGKVFVVMVSGLKAGEYQAQTFGPGKAGLVIYHFDKSIEPIPEKVKAGGLFSSKVADLNPLDKRTFMELKSGLNITELKKGERVKVNKFYMRSDYVELQLTPLDPHLEDLDVNKASGSSRTSFSRFGSSTRTRVAGFGLDFVFLFDDKVLEASDSEAILNEIGRYLAPPDKAEELLAQANSIEVNIGMTEEELIQNLGQPLKSIKVGEQKVMKYKDITVTLKDGKVVDVKIE